MRKLHFCALLSVVSIAALQAWPAAAASPERQLSQERWMLRQAGARTNPSPEVRVHFFNPNQVIRLSRRTAEAQTLRPALSVNRPAPARPLIVATTRSVPQLAASHPAGGALSQPEIRSGR